MLAPRCDKRLLGILFCCAGTFWAQSEQTKTTVRHYPAPVTASSAASALLDQGEALLAKGDYTGAQPLLQQATVKDPKSYQAWYDLGYAEQALRHETEAIAAYRKSVELNPKVFESNLNLGIALAASSQPDEATKYLAAATGLQPVNHPQQAKEHAWISLGRLQLNSDPAAAERAFGEAVRILPSDPEPHLLLAELQESSGKLDEAKAQYRQALAGAQGEFRAQALRGLVNIAITSKQYGEAESNVRQYLADSPSDSQAHLLLGRLLTAQGKNEEGLAELTSAGKTSDPSVLHEQADLLSALHREAEAVPIYKRLIDQEGHNAQLRYSYGLALMHLHQTAPAEEQIIAALKLNPNLARAYGDLAVVASDNQHYDLALKALEVRTKLLGDNPGTYFLRATALDHLRRFPEATQNYRQFLAVANGKYPDEEWKARHRLIAIQNLK